jgi:hypothetical protein
MRPQWQVSVIHKRMSTIIVILSPTKNLGRLPTSQILGCAEDNVWEWFG